MEFAQKTRDRFRSPELPYSQELEEPICNDDQCLVSSAKQRSRTDLPFLILHAAVIIVFLFFLGYCIANGDIQRLTRGYDDCGNICGKMNTFDLGPDAFCRSADMTDKPFLHIEASARKCVKSCPPDTISAFGDRCISKDPHKADPVEDVYVYVNMMLIDLRIYSKQIIYLSLIAVAFSFAILLVLQYFAKAFVWTVLTGTIVAAVLGSVSRMYHNTNNLDYVTYAFALICITVVLICITVVSVVIIVVLRKHIPLVIQLFVESGKSIGDIPILLFQPILTFVALAIVWSAWLDFTLWIESAGTPVMQGYKVVFQKNIAIAVSRWYNIIVMLWMVKFIYGCQSMLLAGAVSTWFFTRNKAKLNKPVYNSAYNMIIYHMGTISFGSLVISYLIIAAIQLMKILLLTIRIMLRRIMNALGLYLVCNYVELILSYMERLARCLTRNTYTITAIHGYPFKEAGKRAYDLLVDNAMQFLSINSVGTFVLFLAKVLIVAATVGIGTVVIKDDLNLSYKWPLLVLTGVAAYLIAHCFLSIYEIATDVIFVCFCEDSNINDGASRPYFMSQDLMEFVQKCKTVVILKQGVQNV